MAFDWFEYPQREDLCDTLAGEIRTDLTTLLENAPIAGLVAAGGTTAPPVLRQIAAAPLDWSRIRVTLSDERWVPATDDASNEKMVRECLLQGPAATARFIPFYQDAETPEAAEAMLHEQLGEMPWPATLCLLGMGRDGHVASLFPNAGALTEALNPGYWRRCKAVRPVTTEIAGPHPRMTLALAAMMQTRHIHILITGADKRATFERARRDGPEPELPVRAVLRQSRVPVSVHWSP